MADRRRYTTTKTLQAGWTILLFVVGTILTVASLLATAVTILSLGALWVAGLVVLGLREHRHWSGLIATSSFDRATTGQTADLQGIIQGKSVTVTTDVTGVFSPEHTQIRAPVEGVNASFTVRIVDRELADSDGLQTGVGALDNQFVITGTEGNVAALLTEQTRDALVTIEPPGTYTVRPDEVVFEIPFTRLSANELAAAGGTVVALALRLEAVGQG